jgi:hypothetical protein
MDIVSGDKSTMDHDLSSPQTDSFWEVCINLCQKEILFFLKYNFILGW